MCKRLCENFGVVGELKYEPVELVNPRAEVGECPNWVDAHEFLYWVDVPRGRIYRCDADGNGLEFQEVNSPVGSIAPCQSGGFLLATQNRVAFLPAFGADLCFEIRGFGVGNTRLNDGKIDPSGRFVVGTACIDGGTGSAELFQLSPNLEHRSILGGITMSNGLGWSPDSDEMYFVDTPHQRVDVFSYCASSGRLFDRRTLVRIDNELGLPDGLTVDQEGSIWLAMWGGGRVLKISQDGRISDEIKFPVLNITSCSFGGVDRRTLFVTTAIGMDGGGGGVYAVRTNSKGIPPNLFDDQQLIAKIS